MAEPIKDPKQLVDEWLNKKIDVEIKTVEDEQLFALVLARMLVDCYNEPMFKEWLNSDNYSDKLKAGLSLARPILASFMFAKDNQDLLKEVSKNEQSGQDIIKS